MYKKEKDKKNFPRKAPLCFYGMQNPSLHPKNEKVKQNVVLRKKFFPLIKRDKINTDYNMLFDYGNLKSMKKTYKEMLRKEREVRSK